MSRSCGPEDRRSEIFGLGQDCACQLGHRTIFHGNGKTGAGGLVNRNFKDYREIQCSLCSRRIAGLFDFRARFGICEGSSPDLPLPYEAVLLLNKLFSIFLRLNGCDISGFCTFWRLGMARYNVISLEIGRPESGRMHKYKVHGYVA